MTWEFTVLDTPLGPAHALARDGKLCALQLVTHRMRSSSPLARLDALDARRVANPAGVTTALAAYFRGDLATLDAVEVDPSGTPFQRAVWAALRTIPHGETTSYGELAHGLAQRAVVATPLGLGLPAVLTLGVEEVDTA